MDFASTNKFGVSNFGGLAGFGSRYSFGGFGGRSLFARNIVQPKSRRYQSREDTFAPCRGNTAGGSETGRGLQPVHGCGCSGGCGNNNVDSGRK